MFCISGVLLLMIVRTSNDDENEVDEDDAGDGGLEIIIDNLILLMSIQIHSEHQCPRSRHNTHVQSCTL